ncbi:MAG: YfhO family protein [Ruminiclostridium sp.]|nr:YfhO family protein [Ruminiclostridium sp.]
MKFAAAVKKQASQFIIRNHIILLSFFLPAFILELAYAVHGIFPFSKWDVLIIDLYHQYAPFISDLQDKFRTLSSLLYSWKGGLGTNYLPLFGYYLASPLNLLTVLFPKDYLTEAVLFLTLLKVGLAGACFSIYLKGVHRKQSLITAAFSLLYALSSYVLVFSWNIMWMDSIYLLPLIMLGMVRLVRDGRGIYFCITLALALFTNFYMAFFICFFALLYYPVCFFQYHGVGERALLFKRTVQFAGYSLLSTGLSAILVLPTYFALKLTSAANNIFPKTLTYYFDMFDFITRHFTFPSPSIREGMPNIYSGIIVLILIPVYFFSRSIRMKEKLWHLALLLTMILSFNMDILNFIWHGMHFPNQIPYRFSFVYVFLVLSMCYKAFDSLQEFTGKQIGAICVTILGLVVISQKFDDLKLDYLTMYASIASIVLYAAALTVDRARYIRPSTRLLIVMLVIITEVTGNTILTINKIDLVEGYSVRDGYSSGKEVKEIRRQIADISKSDTGFYRMELMPPKTTNDPYLYNYRGLSFFSSTSSKLPVKMLENLGYHSNSINSVGYEGSTAILDSLFGIKYLIYRSMNIEEKLYKKIASTDEITVFTNPYALPLGFQVPVELKKFYSYSSNPFDAQNSLMKSISGIKDILVPIDQKQGVQYNLTYNSSGTKYYSFKRTDKDNSSTAKVQIKVEKDQQVYLYFKAPFNMKGSAFVTVNGKKVDFNPRHSTIIDLGFCKSGTLPEMEITFDKTAPESGRFEVYSSGLDIPAFEKAISIIRDQAMIVDKVMDTGIRGSVEIKTAGLMAMSVLYDKGWHVKVDGKEVQTLAIDDSLLAFELAEGPHTVETWFIPDKFFLGLGITMISLLILILLFIKRLIIKRQKNNPYFSDM